MDLSTLGGLSILTTWLSQMLWTTHFYDPASEATQCLLSFYFICWTNYMAHPHSRQKDTDLASQWQIVKIPEHVGWEILLPSMKDVICSNLKWSLQNLICKNFGHKRILATDRYSRWINCVALLKCRWTFIAGVWVFLFWDPLNCYRNMLDLWVLGDIVKRNTNNNNSNYL